MKTRRTIKKTLKELNNQIEQQKLITESFKNKEDFEMVDYCNGGLNSLLAVRSYLNKETRFII